jgi:hypothetical protein
MAEMYLRFIPPGYDTSSSALEEAYTVESSGGKAGPMNGYPAWFLDKVGVRER